MWGSIERQHLSNVSTTKDHLHAVVCRIPLVDGAKVPYIYICNSINSKMWIE